MRVLLTGGTGFIGSHMVELLLARGGEVVCPVRDTGELRHLKGMNVEAVPLEALEYQISSGPGFDYVFHFAGATRARTFRAYQKANVKLTWRLLEWLSDHSSGGLPARFVLVSSQAAVGPSCPDGTPMKESDPPGPISLYGRSKLEAEVVAASFKDRLPLTIVRPSTVFGPRDVDVLGVFRSARFRVAPCLAGPDRLVSIIYVEDLAEGILQAALSPASVGRTYFLANPKPVVWKEFCRQVARVLGYRAFAIPVPLHLTKILALGGDLIGKVSRTPPLFRSEKFDEMRQIAWICSTDRALSDLGWQARTPLEEALKKTAAWYRRHGWI